MAELISNPIRIPCGGFDIDNDTLYFQNDVLKSKREDPELPAVSAIDNGKVLTVAEGSWTVANPVTELPSVTSDDNGDVLTVVEGAWAKATPSGSGVLMCTLDVANGVLNKTWQEIHDAMETGPVFVVSSNVGSIGVLPITVAVEDSGTYVVHVMEEGEGGVYIALDFTTDSANGYPVVNGG